jgi:hypothetical protein
LERDAASRAADDDEDARSSASSADGDVVKLNVGGARFETTLAVLTKVEDSILGRMFGRCDAMLQADPEDGSIFIDRDGDVFGMLLDFLQGSRRPGHAEDHARVARGCAGRAGPGAGLLWPLDRRVRRAAMETFPAGDGANFGLLVVPCSLEDVLLFGGQSGMSLGGFTRRTDDGFYGRAGLARSTSTASWSPVALQVHIWCERRRCSTLGVSTDEDILFRKDRL